LSVRGDIKQIRDALGRGGWPPGSVAIFSCSGRGLYEEIPLPRQVREQVVVDETPFTRPMLAVLSEFQRVCVLVVDKASARIWELDQDELRTAGSVRDPVLRKRDYAAGLAEDRVRNKAEELAKRHFRRVVQLLGNLLQTRGCELLIIGGHDYEIPEFVQFLPGDVRDRVAGTFCADPGSVSPIELRRCAGEILARYQREQEHALVSSVLAKAAAGQPAALGLESCLWAGCAAAIETLVVVEGATVPGVVCDKSGWLALAGDACPICGSRTRRTPDVIDELVEAVVSESGLARHVMADARLSEYIVAAELRFPLPPPAHAQ
jgi:peptide chain release factor subunit 1